ncbi:GNAT family N-acetyltransferase [Yimella sp. cx-573]|nr:GNAT family N-acetyltransferase [Yimella sp. cx-573]
MSSEPKQPHPNAPSTVRTKSLVLRPITEADTTDPRILKWHTDSEGYELMAESPRTPDEASESMQLWHEGWKADGLSYWIAERDGVPVGIGGLRHVNYQNHPHLNLYYRLDPAARARGYGREIASAATAFALEWLPQLPVTSRIAPRNIPSLRTIERAGMIGLGPFRMPHDPSDEPDNLLFESPVIRLGIGEAYEEVLDVWCRVNADGGAVGWEDEAPVDEVARVLDAHLAADGATLVRLHAPNHDTWSDATQIGDLLGFGVVQRGTWFSTAHRATLYRVMTDPDLRGRNLGALLMGALHGVARRDGMEICEIGYRGGTGLESFYERFGYRETGRVVGGLRFSWGDEDDVAMARPL